MSILKLIRSVLITSTLCYTSHAISLTLPLPAPDSDVVGEVRYVTSQEGDSLFDVARRYGIGRDEMITANYNVHPNSILSRGTQILIPSQFILPAVPRKGIVINLAEMRLYYYPPGEGIVITEPVGIGKEGGEWATPLGTTTIIKKEKEPSWRPTANVRAEAAKNGKPIPAFFPPGPDNPLGKHVLRLGWPTYLIHGTNQPEGVGGRVSAGCVRMLPEDVEQLYQLVEVGTPVRVINEPFKVGWRRGELYFEAHKPLLEEDEDHAVDLREVVAMVHDKIKERRIAIKWSVIKNASQNLLGIPQVITF